MMLNFVHRQASLLAQQVMNLPAMQETWVRSLGQEGPLEKEMATHSSVLAWRILWTEEPGKDTVQGVAGVGHDLATTPPPGRSIKYPTVPCQAPLPWSACSPKSLNPNMEMSRPHKNRKQQHKQAPHQSQQGSADVKCYGHSKAITAGGDFQKRLSQGLRKMSRIKRSAFNRCSNDEGATHPRDLILVFWGSGGQAGTTGPASAERYT